MDTMKLPLEGIRILDLTVSWAGPKVTQCLADMGAEVIKVESIQYLDAQRGRKKVPRGMPWYPDGDPGEHPWNRYGSFNQLNRNKLSITLDLQRSQGREIFLRLVRISDIAVDCFSATVMEDFLNYDLLRETRPDIIVMRMPAFGMSGPYRNYRGWGSTVDCMAGGVSARGYLGGIPLMPRSYGDPIAGYTGALALLIALQHRESTGEGQFIDMAQVEALVPFSAESFMDFALNGRIYEPSGNHHLSMAPHNVYRCKGEDKWIAIAISTEEEWKSFCDVSGNTEWSRDERFSNFPARLRNQEELDSLIEQWTIQREHYEIMQLLQSAGIAAGAVLTSDEIFSDPHLLVRDFFRTVNHSEAGTHPYPGPSWKFSKTPSTIRLAAPCLGEHNRYVLQELLHLSSEEIAKLEKDKIIGTEPLEEAVS